VRTDRLRRELEKQPPQCSCIPEIAGRRFGKLLVLQRVESNKKFRLGRYLCQCDCGNRCVVYRSALVTGRTRSCGCSRKSPRPDRRGIPNKALRKNKAGSWKRLLYKYKQGARKRALEWRLTDDEARHMFHQPCHYCGLPPQGTFSLGYPESTIRYNGIDRVDNTEGYVPGNVVACCKYCQYMKRDLTLDFFLQQVEKIYSQSVRS